MERKKVQSHQNVGHKGTGPRKKRKPPKKKKQRNQKGDTGMKKYGT